MTLSLPRFRRVAAIGAVAALALTACSSGGGRDSGGGGVDTDPITVAMITHQAPGDTFWDIIRKGADAAAAKSNVTLEYSGDPDASRQAQLIQAAIDKGVDGIAVTSPNTGAIGPTIQKAVEAGIPVTMFNAGGNDWQDLGGVISYFGQGEFPAGVAVGERAVADGGSNILCVIQEQGQQQLEDRCDGVIEGAGGATVKRVYVDGRDDSAVVTTLQAELTADSSVDFIVTLGAPFALGAVKAVDGAGSSAKIGTFDTNAELVKAIQDDNVLWAIDQQPYLQGYLSVDQIWLYINNGNIIGGGQSVPTGPAFIDSANVDVVAEFAAGGTR